MKYVFLSLFSAILVGCQTIPTYDLTEQDLAVLKQMERLPSQKCNRKIADRVTGKVITEGLSLSPFFTIKKFSKSSSGWYQAYGLINDIWGNVYFNPSTGQVICGGTNWSIARPTGYNSSFREFPRAGGGAPGAVPPQSQVRSTPEPRQGSNSSELRSIAVTWEGVADLLAGTLNLQQNGRSGVIEITLPNGLGKCSGGFNAQDKNRGEWRVSCPDSKSASGTYVAYGDGKGSKGVGFDNVGRKVTYTMGARLTDTQQPYASKLERIACQILKQRIKESNNSAYSYLVKNIENNSGTFNPDDTAPLVGDASSWAVLKYGKAFKAQVGSIHDTCGVRVEEPPLSELGRLRCNSDAARTPLGRSLLGCP